MLCRLFLASLLRFVVKSAIIWDTLKRGGVMEQRNETLAEVKEPVETEAKLDYDLHIKVPAEMRSILRDSAELAFKLGDIPKPDLVDLMNLFIGWGLQIQKQKWLDRVGYH